MSVQFGRWNFEGDSPPPDYIDKVRAMLAPFGPDGDGSYSNGGVTILYRAFHTTKESRRERQPYISASGAVITWDGRLDNRKELVRELRNSVKVSSTDIEIVAVAYEMWGTDCFARLVGDWGLSIWTPKSRSLILAKDPIGARHLYYSIDKDHVSWSSILDPLVLFARRTLAINEEYIAGWFAYYPAPHLTPYVGIHGVQPSSFVVLRQGKYGAQCNDTRYWDFDPGKLIRYHTDAEYEEHFRTALATAVQRSLRSDFPVLAELSGGMDSSSIVCTADLALSQAHNSCNADFAHADTVTRRANIATDTAPRLDTISWFNDSDPNWKDHLYFPKIEENRGRNGWHIDLSTLKDADWRPVFAPDRLAATPIPDGGSSEFLKQYAAHLASGGYRVVLSGIGGDSVTGGGVPTPRPELQNLLARARFFTLARQLNAWASKMKTSRLPLLWEATRGFFSFTLSGVSREMHPSPWFLPGFVRHNRSALRGYPYKLKLSGPLPSFQDNMGVLNAWRRVLAHVPLAEPIREVRYPYFDRDLLEFLYGIPQEQIVGVGRRRHLMRRALIGIVPEEVLNRRRKDILLKEPIKESYGQLPDLLRTDQPMISHSIGIIDTQQFMEAWQKADRTDRVLIRALLTTLTLECWLRNLVIHGIMTTLGPIKVRTDPSSVQREEVQAISNQKFS